MATKSKKTTKASPASPANLRSQILTEIVKEIARAKDAPLGYDRGSGPGGSHDRYTKGAAGSFDLTSNPGRRR